MSGKKRESLPDLVKTRRRVTKARMARECSLGEQLLGKNSVGAWLVNLWTCSGGTMI
jgi:hypothetical protein